jgi:uncharacterized protein (DUF1810 family)
MSEATKSDDPYELHRFVLAQQGVFARVCAELGAGAKVSHWMWFIFPQLKGLGASPTAQHFGIASLAEARAYLAHPLLGERLRRCTRLVNEVRAKSARQIFGYPDELKFRSCMTLFASAAQAHAAAGNGVFGEALARYFAGEPDPLTRARLT